jgi:hypothetical protein
MRTWMTEGTMDRDAVKKLARSIVAECAPDDLDLFDSTADLLLEDLPRAVAGDPRRDRPAAGGIAVVLPDMVKLALYLADHLTGAAADIGLEKAGEAVLKRRRERKKAATNRAPLISIVVNRQPGGTEIMAVIDGREFPVSARQAADLLVYVASHPVSADPPASPDSQRLRN